MSAQLADHRCGSLLLIAITLSPIIVNRNLAGDTLTAFAAPQTGPSQAQINAGIDKGVGFLKQVQLPTGGWPENADPKSPLPKNYEIGYASLGGLTLLECGVLANDPAVRKAAAYVRSTPIADRAHRNYQMASAILFLDRLGDPKDEPLIRTYAVSLIAGQSSKGGWSYDSPDLSDIEQRQLLTFLEATRLSATAEPTGGKPAAKKPSEKTKSKPALPLLQSLSPLVRDIPLVKQYYLPKAQPSDQPPGRPMRLDDNSNTQFALLALWAARRHEIPSERCMLAAGQRFAATQIADGGWTYSTQGLTLKRDSSPTMTCVGLLSLAMARAVLPAAKGKPAEDPMIVKGLQRLGGFIDAQSMSNFYLLWSIERVGMLYQLKTLGNKDWYEVGSEALLARQQDDGSWYKQGGYAGCSPALDTCFALLFLKRSNLVQDLSDRLPLLLSITDSTGKR